MQYFYSLDGTTQQGPLDAAELPRAGVGPTTMVWREGMPDWQPAGRVAELAAVFAAAPVPTPRAPAPLPHASPGQSMPLPPGGLMDPRYARPDRIPGTNGLAIASLVLGIVGVFTFCCFVPSILAIVFGYNARAQIRRGQGEGIGLATVGLILGWLGILFAIIGVSFRFTHGHFYYNGHRFGY